jgi:hypothetical protein
MKYSERVGRIKKIKSKFHFYINIYKNTGNSLSTSELREYVLRHYGIILVTNSYFGMGFSYNCRDYNSSFAFKKDDAKNYLKIEEKQAKELFGENFNLIEKEIKKVNPRRN